ncbi:MAG TPA: hypothetical protein VME63_16470 [Dyella sp.]|uniref:hypothetical protein n=1 Tax=Dyella sp. TaxID=1869338 RepID=UPI002C41E2A4|nr:hypothetical protein [Dyella sp.]HTV86996.1 hypothetical protein [Dyella sp.]
MSRMTQTGWLLAVAVTAALAGCAQNASAPKPAPASVRRAVPSVSTVFQDKQSYLAQHFTVTLLVQPVQDYLTQMGSAPVSFDRLLITQKSSMTKPGADAPSHFINVVEYENAGNGLVRSINTLQNNGFDISTYFDLTYRGIFPLRSQKFLTASTTWPFLFEARQIDHLDTDFSAPRITYSYRNGISGRTVVSNPIQISCTSGLRYSASTLNPSIEGMAHELNCQWQNGNGVVTSDTTYTYLEKYGVAFVSHVKTSTSDISVAIDTFKVE